jgi:hypothetical protein
MQQIETGCAGELSQRQPVLMLQACTCTTERSVSFDAFQLINDCLLTLGPRYFVCGISSTVLCLVEETFVAIFAEE